MSGSDPPPRLVDTVALAALARSGKEDRVFSTVPITVTRCCFQELQRGRDDADQYSYRRGCSTAIEKIREWRGNNVQLYPTDLDCRDQWGRLRDNIGEKSIARALERESRFQLVVSFDDDVIDGSGGMSSELKQMFRQSVPQFDVAPANEPLYRLYRSEDVSKAEFVEATERMIDEMGWRDAEFVDRFWDAYNENFDR